MDRSGRRTAVVAWAIAVGVMFGGAAATAAPVSADDRTEAAGDADGDSRYRGPARGDANDTPARPVRGPGPGTSAPVPPGPSPPGPVPPDPCPWWFPPPSAPPARNSQAGLPVGVPSIASVTPVPVFGDGRIVGGARPDSEFGLSLPPVPAPESPPAQGPGAPSALVAPSPVVPPAVPVVAAAPVGPPALSVPDMPAPGLVGPVPAAPASLPAVPQRPEPPPLLPELRPDDLGRIAASAVPGLAALVGMTLLGGVIGYRQARAGYLLRAAGAGRFLQ